MKKQEFSVCGEKFATKKELTERIREILYSYKDGKQLNMFDFPFMLDVLAMHPLASQKIGCGVSRMEVRENPVYKKNFGFWLIRNDGTETDFSFVECLSPSSQRKKVLAAFRASIEEQTMQFKRNFFDSCVGGVAKCSLTGETITFLNSHVDHMSPRTFENLFDTFLIDNNLNVEGVELSGEGVDGNIQDKIADGQLDGKWKEFHRMNAVLRVVSRFGNLSIAKTEREVW